MSMNTYAVTLTETEISFIKELLGKADWEVITKYPGASVGDKLDTAMQLVPTEAPEKINLDTCFIDGIKALRVFLSERFGVIPSLKESKDFMDVVRKRYRVIYKLSKTVKELVEEFGYAEVQTAVMNTDARRF